MLVFGGVSYQKKTWILFHMKRGPENVDKLSCPFLFSTSHCSGKELCFLALCLAYRYLSYNCKIGTLLETSIAPEDRPSQKETSIPIVQLQPSIFTCYVSFRDGNLMIHVQQLRHPFTISKYTVIPMHRKHLFWSFFSQTPNLKKPETKVTNLNTITCWWFQPI